jgi:sigma-B regulation protein RsbU (phosphoserine phosphatase)
MEVPDMGNVRKKTGSLGSKIMRLCIAIVVCAVIVFFISGIIEISLIRKMTTESVGNQTAVIKNRSMEALTGIVEGSLKQTVRQAAENSGDEFWSLDHDFRILGQQVEDVFKHPENYREVPVNPPSKENGGKYVQQLMFADWADQNDEETLKMVRKLGNLAPMMEEIIRGNSEYTMDCYIALPSGATIAMDVYSDQKFEEDGSVKFYDPTTRAWYNGAVEKGDMYFSEAIHSYFYDLTEVVFGYPIYVDGQLVAVLEGSTKLDALQKLVSELSFSEQSFSILVSGDGQLVYSPRTSGDLAMDDMLSTDIRETDNPELKELVDSALAQEEGFSTVRIDGENYYVAYAPLKIVGWTQMMFVSEKDLLDSTDSLLAEIDTVNSQTVSEFGRRIRKTVVVIVIVMVILIISAVTAAALLSKRMVTPIRFMTERVSSMDGENISFEMEKVYETGDEIEVLAGAFRNLTEKLKNYITEVSRISAEKERIDTEMATANQIQSSMLPRIFPAFPERPEFSLYADMKPAREVGGDLYDYYFIDDDNLAIVIGDVSGKGISAALFMVMTKHIIQSQIMLHGGDVEAAIQGVNTLLMEENAAGMFVTVWLGVLNIPTGHLAYINAGHEYPIIYRSGEEYVLYKDLHGAPVACRKAIKTKLNEMDLSSGDVLYLYTDGITEATDNNRNMYGCERILEVLNSNPEADVRELDEAVRADIDRFVGDAEQFDDMTTLCIRFWGPGGK